MTDLAENAGITAEFTALNHYFDAVTQALDSGAMPDLQGVDERIYELCETVKAEPDRDSQIKYLQLLEDLLARLDVCGKQMHAFHEAQQKAAL